VKGGRGFTKPSAVVRRRGVDAAEGHGGEVQAPQARLLSTQLKRVHAGLAKNRDWEVRN
jgi:hypothetical protein